MFRVYKQKAIFKEMTSVNRISGKIINYNETYSGEIIFDEKIININDIKVEGTTNENLSKSFNKILLKENNLQNKIYFKKLINDAIRSYAG